MNQVALSAFGDELQKISGIGSFLGNLVGGSKALAGGMPSAATRAADVAALAAKRGKVLPFDPVHRAKMTQAANVQKRFGSTGLELAK
jgi:hypothetical protein